MASKAVGIFLGQCVPSVKANASKIRIKRMVLDTNLLMVITSNLRIWPDLLKMYLFQYFKKDEFVFAHDPEKLCKTGDIVLIKELPQKLTKLITFSVENVVYPLGDITDPITGKKCVVGKYREDIEEANRLYGKSESGFDYTNAPPRGSQEGKRDFTHGETYIKYHEDGKDQPFAV